MRALVALNGKDGQPARGPQATFLKPRRALPGWLPVAGLRHWLKQLGDTAASFPRGLCLVRHDRRRLLWLVATTHPTAEWIAQQLVEACAWDQAPRYLIRDRDRSYGEVFVRRVRAMGIRDRPTSPRSPWQNGYAERLIGSIRRECIDHVIVLSERHLHHLLRSYLDYYNETRTHLSLDKDAPVSRASSPAIAATPARGAVANASPASGSRQSRLNVAGYDG